MLAQTDVIAYVLADLVLILVAARIVGRIAEMLGQPRVVGQIAAGILIGPTVLGGHVGIGSTTGVGLVDQIYPPEAYAFLNLIGQVGLVLYLFLVGIEVDRHLLRGRRRQIALLAVASALAPIALGFAAAPAFANSTWRPPGVSALTFSLFLAAGLAATALPVLARMLQEKDLIASAVGVTSVGVSGIVTVVAFLLVAAGSASASGGGVAREITIKMALAGGLIVVLLAVAPPLLSWTLGFVDETRHTDSILTVLLVLALASGLLADRIGVQALVGGFLLGLAVPVTRGIGEMVLARLKDVVVLVFLPVFFAVSGIVTNLRVLDLGVLPGMLFFLVLLVVGKWGSAYVAGRAGGLARAEAHTVGALLCSGGALTLVVGLIGLQLGVITPALHAAFVLGALVTLLPAGPIVDRFAARRVPPG